MSFGGKIAGLSGGTINKISGIDATTLFNFGGSTTKYYYLIRVRGSRTGDFSNTGNPPGVRQYTYQTGWRLYRKPNDSYNGLIGGNGGYTEVASSLGEFGEQHFYAKDIYAVVTPARGKTYTQFDSLGGSETPTAYHTNTLSGDTNFP